MSDPRDPHLEVLVNIWGEMKTLSSTVNTTNERLASFERATTERLDIHGRGITRLVEEVSKLNTRMDNFLVGAHGKEHDELRTRVEHLEKRTGLR